MQSRSKIGFIFIVVYLSLLSFGTLIQRGTSVTSGNYPHLQFTFTYDNQTTFSTDVITINWSYSLSGGKFNQVQPIISLQILQFIARKETYWLVA